MLKPTAQRFWEGIRVDGEQISIELLPNSSDCSLRVSVIASPSLTGYDRSVRISESDARSLSFRRSEVEVSDTRLTCLASDETVPFLRSGFDLVLEPGMAPLIRAWLPRLFDVAALSSGIVKNAHAQLISLDPPVHAQHLYGIFAVVAAGVVLDARDPETAIAAERDIARHTARHWDEEFAAPVWAIFNAEGIHELLQKAHSHNTQLLSTT